jgi:hypothetical protein
MVVGRADAFMEISLKFVTLEIFPWQTKDMALARATSSRSLASSLCVLHAARLEFSTGVCCIAQTRF